MSSLRQVVARGPRLSKCLHKDGSSAKHGLGYESSTVTCTRYHSRPGAALPSADSADGRQSCQPITCVPAVAGGGIRGDDDDDDDDADDLPDSGGD